MRQTTLCVPLEVKPESCGRLSWLIDQLKEKEDKAGDSILPNFHRLKEQIPILHFMSMSVFRDGEYDPIFILEANFDGEPGPFWAQLEVVLGDPLRRMLRCCKEPGDETAALYRAVTTKDSRMSIAPYLEARTQRPSVFHHGNRGLTRNRILAEHELFTDLVEEIDKPGPSAYRGHRPSRVHKTLREIALAKHPWLNTVAPRRIGLLESLSDGLALFVFIVILIVVLAAPGVLLWLCCWLAGYVSGSALVALGFGAISVSVVLLLLAAWLRWTEKRESSVDQPRMEEALYRDMVRREDWITQNHMNSIVHIRPGILRTLILKLGHRGLHLFLRASPRARSGYLGSMRTVHFAHWAFLNNSSRLLFLSNYDHSWDSYLDDFIEKAAVGLTLSWGSGVGFPRTRWLIKGGAEHGRQFKTWALASRAVSRFWYSAYPKLSVDQIERNHRIANGLRKTSMNDRQAREWMTDL